MGVIYLKEPAKLELVARKFSTELNRETAPSASLRSRLGYKS